MVEGDFFGSQMDRNLVCSNLNMSWILESQLANTRWTNCRAISDRDNFRPTGMMDA